MTHKVYEAINNVSEDLSKEGIGKDRKNQSQSYNFRGIDDIYNALAPLLAKHKLCILPDVMNRTLQEKTTKSGGILFFTTVQVKFSFVSAEDGSRHEVITFGEAMDSGDKSTNKAMSAAYKYACMQAFCIPTEGDGKDSEEQTHEVVKETPQLPHDKETGEIIPAAIPVPVLADGKGSDWMHFVALFATAIKGSKTAEELKAWRDMNDVALTGLHKVCEEKKKKTYAGLMALMNARDIELSKNGLAK